ncbi:MAG: quinone-dependent dihydroorotate dehydrogenase [Chthoniobacterales bacterium]
MRGGYERFVRPWLFSINPEAAHHLAIHSLRVASIFPPALGWLRRFQPPANPKSLFGLTFANPVGLAAGFDKNGAALPAWEAIGFGFVEIGTVTARAQMGNPKPRIFRYANEQALINRLGFNNDGAALVAARLRKLRASGRWPRIPVGINIGKSKITPLEVANDDYLFSLGLLEEFADYIVLNVSSPNTPGLRSLQEHDALTSLLRAVSGRNSSCPRKPVLLKIAPDLSRDELGQIVAACEASEIAGIVATNTTLDHGALASARGQGGGLSGAPLRQKSTEVIRFLRSRTQLPIIGVGGIFDAPSAQEKLDAGAQLLQIYTGFIYRGPGILRELATA